MIITGVEGGSGKLGMLEISGMLYGDFYRLREPLCTAGCEFAQPSVHFIAVASSTCFMILVLTLTYLLTCAEGQSLKPRAEIDSPRVRAQPFRNNLQIVGHHSSIWPSVGRSKTDVIYRISMVRDNCFVPGAMMSESNFQKCAPDPS